MHPMTDVPERQPGLKSAASPIAERIEMLDGALGRLDDAIKYADDRSSRLEHRLNGVLGPPLPRPGDIGHLAPPSTDDVVAVSPLADLLEAKAKAIHALADRIQSVATDLDYLADRVEL